MFASVFCECLATDSMVGKEKITLNWHKQATKGRLKEWIKMLFTIPASTTPRESSTCALAVKNLLLLGRS